MTTYNASVPQSSDSPSIFPAQGQANFGRLLTVFGVDHQFNLSAATNDGWHKVVHLIQQAPTGPDSGFGRLYVKLQGPAVQLFYLDDLGVEHQITPFYDKLPFKVTGNTAVLAPNATESIFPNLQPDFTVVGYNYTGFGFAFYNGTTTSTTNSFMRIGGIGDEHKLTNNGNNFPTIEYSGTSLVVRNNATTTKTINYSLMVNRL